ncbi:hypothetical protein K435DRAFT_594715, partial [Dendrothele bispora CBS 962.96]
KEMQRGHPDRMKHNLGVHGHVFKKLKKELQEVGSLRPRRHVDTNEILATFLYQATTNLSVRKIAERFQRSFETVS